MEIARRFLVCQFLDRGIKYGHKFQVLSSRPIKRAKDQLHVDLVDLLCPVIYINEERDAVVFLGGQGARHSIRYETGLCDHLHHPLSGFPGNAGIILQYFGNGARGYARHFCHFFDSTFSRHFSDLSDSLQCVSDAFPAD